MNGLMKWVRENLALPLVMVLLTAIVAGIYELTEIDGRQYATLSRMYFEGTDRYRANLRTIAEDGAINKWTFIGLQRDYFTDAKALTLPPYKEFAIDPERTALMEQIKSNVRQHHE